METKKVTFNNGTTLGVGDEFLDNMDDVVKILFIDGNHVFGKNENGFYGCFDAKYDIFPYTPPTPQKEWKTFLIEFSDFKCIGMYLSKEDAWNLNKGVISITEVKLTIEPVNS